MSENPNPVNLPVAVPDLVGQLDTSVPGSSQSMSYIDIFNGLVSQAVPNQAGYSTIPTATMPNNGRYPFFYPGMDNEELYAKAQTGWEKAKNGIINFAGTTAATFLQGTVGTAYGVYSSTETGKFSSVYSNPLSESLNTWSNSLSDKYALYKTEREREGSWWEPSNLFTANFLWDNIVRNLGFSVGTLASGFVWGAALKAVGLTSKLVGMGTEMAAAADDVIAGAAKLPQLDRLSAINSGLNKVLGKALMKADRGIVAATGTAGEAGLEALNNAQQFRQSMIEEFENTHGYSPNQQEMQIIDNYASSVGNWSYYLNAGLLTLTNYVQLPRIVGSSFKADKEILENVAFKGGKYLSTLPEKGFGKLLYKTKNIASLFFNEVEAFEEGAQYTVQTGTQNYFNKKRKGYEPSVLDDGILAGARETLTSDEGLLNLFIGGLAGAIQTSGIFTLGKTGKISERGITGYGGSEGRYREEAIGALNKSLIRDKLREAYSTVKAAEIIQKDREDALRRGDMLESKDLEFDYAHNFISNRLKYNAKESISDELNYLRTEASTADGFLKLQQQGIAAKTDTPASFNARLNNIEEHANNAATLYEAAKLKYKGKVDDKGKRIYTDDVIDKMVYAGAKVMDYDRRIPGINSRLVASGIDTLKILDDILNNGSPTEEATKDAISSIKTKGGINESDLMRDLVDIIDLSLRRKLFIDEYKDIVKNPSKYKEEPQVVKDTVSTEAQKGTTVTIKTKTGDHEIEVGEEYFLGRVVEYDKDGNEVYRAPKLKILGVSEDGKKVTIEDSKGVREIDASLLEDYKLGKVSSTLADKKAKFFMENWNTIFEFNFGKGKKQKGRLEYSQKDKTLIFKYKDKNGKIREIEVTGDQFVAKKGFAQAMIVPVGEYTKEQKESLEEYNKEKDERLHKKREKRLEILNTLFDEVASKQKEIESLITKKKAELTNTQEELNKLREQIEKPQEQDKRYKAFRFKPTTRKALDATIRLSRMQEQLEREIEALEAQKDDTEFTLSYISEMAQFIDEMPTNSREFLEDLNNQILDLEILGEETAKQITSLHSLIDQIKETIDSAIDFLADLLNDFEKKYPKVPRILGNEWVEFLKNNPNFLKRKPNYKEDLKEVEDLLAQVEDLEITANEEKLKELTNKIEELQKVLAKTEKELIAKNTILERFERVNKEYEEQEKQKELLKDEKTIKAALGTADKKNVPTKNVNEKENFEPVAKKSDKYIWRATMGVIRGDKPHQLRANKFGFNLDRFKNRKNLRGVYITAKNEKLLGLEGLVDFIADQADEPIDKNEVIALVMVDVSGETPVVVNEKGEAVTENLLDNVVFQVFPSKELKWSEKYGGESMFRKGTDEDLVKRVKEYYADFRSKTIKESESSELFSHEIGASFGFPLYSQQIDQNGNVVKNEKGRPVIDYSTRTAVEDAKLIEEGDFDSSELIYIPTLDEHVVNGTTSYQSETGRPFLRTPNGDVPLQNRKHTKKEAQTIFDVLVLLAKNMANPEIGFIDKKTGKINDKCAPLIQWLESVVYWHPEGEAGFNSIFWKRDESGGFSFVFSGKDTSFPFNSLLENKGVILGIIEGMYGNVNNWKAKQISAPYTEILEVKPSGELITRNWINYQAYLLSKKFIAEREGSEGDRSARSDVPLSTVILPLKNEDDTNRTGIYFFTEDNKGEVDLTVTSKVMTAGKPKKQEPVGNKFTFTGKSGRKLVYIVADNGDVTILPEGDVKVVVQDTMKNLKAKFPDLTEEELREEAKSLIKKTVKAQYKKEEDDTFTIGEEEKPIKKTPVEKKEAVEEEDDDVFIVGDDVDQKINKINEETEDWTNDIEERVVIEEQQKKFEKEVWPEIESWLKRNFPNIPVYRVKNIIQATNGRQAWGMFKDGAIYVYENAEVGTVYHEVFEAVWKMMSSPQEQQAIMDEFKQRKGSFVDRPSGTTVKYSNASPQQIKEQLAEEFRDYVQYKKIPAKPKTGRPFILKLFYDLYNLVKEFFFGKEMSKVEEMFNNINTGMYKDRVPYQTNLSFANKGVIDIDEAFATSEDELREALLNDTQRSEVLQSMTYYTIRDLIDKDESLFNLSDHITKNKSELYDYLQKRLIVDLRNMYGAEGGREMMRRVISDWDNILKRHEEYLRQYNIEFDENDELQIRNEDKIKESDYVEANKIDHLKKANSAMKMLLSTIPMTDASGRAIRSTMGGPKLLPLNRVWVSLLNNLHSSKTVEEMMFNLKEMAKRDSNYRGLFKRLTKRDWNYEVANINAIDLSHIHNEHSARLLASFYSLFRKAHPEVQTVTIFDNGEISVGDTNLSTFAAQLKSDFVNEMILAAKKGSRYFVYNPKKKTYSGNKETIGGVVLADASSMVNFLKEIGIVFNLKDVQELPKDKFNKFKEAVAGIRRSISEGSELVTISGRTLKLNNRLLDLGYIKAGIDHPEFDSTFFNINGERTQSFIGTNPASDLYDFLSKIDNIEELRGTRYEYLLTDSFAQGSNILRRMFSRAGKRVDTDEAKRLMKTAYISGTDNISKGKRKESARLSQKERFVQEINLNIEGYYLNLVPGDASMEHAVYMGNAVSLENIKNGMETIHNVFRGYFISELELVREANIRESSMAKLPKGRKRNAKEMRFFKSILGDQLHREVLMNSDIPAEEIYKRFEGKINRAVDSFISDQNSKLNSSLRNYGIITWKEERGTYFDNINFGDNLSEDELKNRLTFLSANYIINNIELHKLLYADPYQYADELKRMKNFNSPRQPLISGSNKMNSVFNRVWNREFKRGDAGWTDFMRDYFRTTVYADIQGISKSIPGYEEGWKETDGGGVITFGAHRQFRIRVGNWNDNEERQFIHDMGYEELIRKGANEEALLEYEKKNPGVKSAYTPIKPIVSGNQSTDVPFNKIVLDKFALYPMSRRLADAINRAGDKSTSNLVSLYEKMRKEDIDYVVFESSRKVGANFTSPFYNSTGEFNSSPYSQEGIVEVPFGIMSVQSEVPSKDESIVTRGSQVTKLVTMDYMEGGVPIDFEKGKSFIERYKLWANTKDKETASPLYKEIKHNEKLLKALIDIGYLNILDKLGIEETYNKEKKQKEYSIKDLSLAGNTLRDEIIKREVSDNISDALQAFIDGKSVLEATPAYHQIRNILYSIADKQVMSQKINGGMKVQISAAALEEVKAAEVDINGKKGFESDTLKFYEKDGERVCEIMIGRWFDSDMSDKELLDYLNNSEEGKKILSGVGFRIPTQKQNSIDRFVIKQFLPNEFGDSIVVPSAIVMKAGSDFDIDKLTIYLKNVMMKGKDIVPVPFYGIGTDAFSKFAEIARDSFSEEAAELEKKILKESGKQQLFGDLALGVASSKSTKKWIPIFKKWFADGLVDGKLPVATIENFFINRLERLNKRYSEITDEDLLEVMIYEKAKDLYRQSMENEYISSMENLISHPENFNRLTKPNSADQLKDLSKEIASKTTGTSFDYENVGNMLDRTFMSRLRHAFVTGKYAIGIAAVNQTNHSLNQRQLIYIDPKRLDKVSTEDKYWLRGAKVKFKDYNKVTIEGVGDVATLSMIRNAERNSKYPEGQDISEIISQFIDGYVDISKGPWIMELGATPNVTSTWLFLVKIGVPIDTVAYFMNQPIIRDYLLSIETSGYSWLFMDNFVSDMLDVYDPQATSTEEVKANEAYETAFTIPSKTALRELLGKKASEMSKQEKLDQQIMLKEFLKYAKMAEHMFHVTQGSNFDTASFNDPYLVFKKFEQLKKAQNSIISDVDELLANSFVGKLGKTVKDIRNALATILKSDSKKVRGIIEKVLLPYINMNDRDFTKLAQKAVNDLFDYAVQTTQGLNKDIFKILIEKGGVATQLDSFMKSIANNPLHPLHGNHIVGKEGILKVLPAPRTGNDVVNNVRIRGLQNKVYDQNLIIWAFRDIKAYLKDKPKVYDSIVELAILQSGLSSSSISFTSVIPYEDFEKYYHSTLMKLDSIANLDNFVELGVFQRNNWNNEDIVPQMKAAWVPTKKGKRYNPAMEFINPERVKNAVRKGTIPPVMNVRLGTKESNFDRIVYSWEKNEELLPANWRVLYPKMGSFDAIKAIKAEMRTKGDYSYINKSLFERVVDSYGTPLETQYKNNRGETVKQNVYKAINAWGDAQRANEFYDVEKKSIIDNGMLKVEGVGNDRIIELFTGKKVVKEIEEKEENTWENEDNTCPVPF